MSEPSKARAAIWYAKRGFHVFPCAWIHAGQCSCRKSDCNSPGKHPITKNGLIDATVEASQIERWWRRDPGANIAISCGPSGFALVDIDPRHGGDDTWAAVAAGLSEPLPDTVRTLTPSGGLHLFFKSPGGIPSGNNKFGPGVDLKSDGGYVLLPRSNHLQGEYRFEVEYSPADIEIAPMPPALIALAMAGRNGNGPHGPGLDSAQVLQGVPEGQRDETLFKLACKLRRAGIPQDMAEKLIREAAANCKPAFSEKDAVEKVRRAYKTYPEAEEPADANKAGDVWSRARTAKEFIDEESAEPDWLVRDLIVRQAVTVIVSPRGLCKTHFLLGLAVAKAGGGIFCGEQLEAGRVLLLDRDNPPAEVKRRLWAWGAYSLPVQANLHVMKRDEVPPLTDAKAWASFPFKEYELVLLDSLSSAMESVKDGEGGENGKAIASLLDLARRGPAVATLANTRKDGQVLRGSGVIGDRVDIVYEVRDATDLELDPKRDTWIDCLPPAAETEWASRSKRRKRRPAYRLGFVPSKFRLGEEPEPFMIEVRLPDDGEWAVVNVTADIELEHEQAKGAAVEERLGKERAAVIAMKPALPLTKALAVDKLVTLGLGRNQARRLLDERTGRDWILAGKGTKTHPYIYMIPSAGILGIRGDSESVRSDDSIPAATVPQGRQESELESPSAPTGSESPDSCRYRPEYIENNDRQESAAVHVEAKNHNDREEF
jgi:hypothetical protein